MYILQTKGKYNVYIHDLQIMVECDPDSFRYKVNVDEDLFDSSKDAKRLLDKLIITCTNDSKDKLKNRYIIFDQKDLLNIEAQKNDTAVIVDKNNSINMAEYMFNGVTWDMIGDFRNETKTIVFVLNGIIRAGIQNTIINFPYNGKIKNIHAYCETTGVNDTILNLEKSSNINFENNKWENLVENIVIKTNQKSTDVICDNIIKEKDYLRINVKSSGDIKNLVVEVLVNI